MSTTARTKKDAALYHRITKDRAVAFFFSFKMHKLYDTNEYYQCQSLGFYVQGIHELIKKMYKCKVVWIKACDVNLIPSLDHCTV